MIDKPEVGNEAVKISVNCSCGRVFNLRKSRIKARVVEGVLRAVMLCPKCKTPHTLPADFYPDRQGKALYYKELRFAIEDVKQFLETHEA